MEHNHSKKNHKSHCHSHSENSNIGIAFFLNLLFTVIEILGGIFTNSIAIISDAIHDFGDSLALAFAWYFQKLSQKGSTKNYTYGYKRFSLLGAIINSIVLTVGSIYILSAAIPRLFSPQKTNSEGMFLLAFIGIIINGIAFLRTRKGSSINERVVSLHLLEDVLGWLAVLLGSAVMYFTNWMIIDPILSILISVFVLFNVFKNIRQTLPILLQSTPLEIEQDQIIRALKSIEKVENIHDLHLWSLDENYNVLTVHIILCENLPMEELAEMKQKVRNILTVNGINHSTIEFEISAENCTYSNCNENNSEYY